MTYKSGDEGAPVLSGARGSLVTVLDAVLVKGYGSKSGAGWTKAFPGLNQAAYRSHAVGPCFYLSIDDNLPNAEARACAFQNMTGVLTGTNALHSLREPFPVTGVQIRKAETPSAPSRRWIIVASNRGFCLWLMFGPYSGWAKFAFGDPSIIHSRVAGGISVRIDTGRPMDGIVTRY